MMGFDFIIRFIFTVQGVQFPALHIEGEWVAVYTVHDISFAWNQFSVFIEYRLVGIFIMFKHEITLYLCIVKTHFVDFAYPANLDTEYEIVSESAKTTHLPLAEYARKQIMQLIFWI